MPTYEAIEGIQIGAFDPGKFKDSIIFSADFDIGFTDKPTKFIINCVNVTGVYNIDESDLSYLDPWKIEFGPFTFRFYLESYQIQKSAGKRVLQLTFVDGSTTLDRIFVALGDKHVNTAANAVSIHMVKFPILCEAPEYYPPNFAKNGLVDLSKVAPVALKNSLLDPNGIYNAAQVGGKIEEGGMIQVGWEQPSIENFHKDCAISDFKYNFTHLLFRIEQYGIGVKGDFLRYDGDPRLQIPLRDNWGNTVKNDRNPFHYESFAGQTLREVLNQWCSIQGFSWYYDFGTNAIQGIDEYGSEGWFRFEEIKKIIDTVTSQDSDGNRTDLLIEQSTESASLEGTKRKYVTTKAIKQASPDNPTNYEYFKPIKFYPIDLPHLVPPNQRGGITAFPNLFRTDTQFRISCGLSRFSPNAREIFNAAIGCHEANGVQVLAEIDIAAHPGMTGNPQAPLAIQWVNQMCLSASGPRGQELIRDMNRWTEYWEIPWKMYFVRYDKDLETKFKEWEKKLSDILGRYYANMDMMQNWERCDSRGYGSFRRFDETIPSSEAHTREGVARGTKPFPFAEVLTDPYGLDINTNLFGPMMGPFAINQFNIMHRDPSWGVSQAEIDGLLRASAPGTNDPDMLEQWRPIFMEVGQNAAAWVLQRLPHLNWAGVGGNVTNWGANMLTLNDANSRQAVMNALMELQNPNDQRKPKVGMMIHPDYSHPNFPWKILNVSYTGYENLKEKNIVDNTNNRSAQFREPCPLLCGGISPRQVFCDGLNHLWESRAWPQGIERWNMGAGVMPQNAYWTIPAFGFQMEYTFPPLRPGQGWTTPPATDIVFPTWAGYIANHKSLMHRRLLEPKINLIINGMMFDGNPPGNVGRLEVQENDISSMIDRDLRSGGVMIKLPLGSMDPFSLAGNFQQFGNEVWDRMFMQDYHLNHVSANEVPTQNAMTGMPVKTLSCTVGGIEFGSLGPYCNPVYGLVSCSVRLGNEGVTSELRFTNKPPLPLSEDVLFRSIQPEIVRAGGIFPMF